MQEICKSPAFFDIFLNKLIFDKKVENDLKEKGYEFDRVIEKTKNRDYETVTYTRYSFKAEEREDKKDEH